MTNREYFCGVSSNIYILSHRSEMVVKIALSLEFSYQFNATKIYIYILIKMYYFRIFQICNEGTYLYNLVAPFPTFSFHDLSKLIGNNQYLRRKYY